VKTLIIVDVQNDFIAGGALAVPDGEAVVPVINRLQPQFDLVIATQDWHPPEHGSFAANHSGKSVGEFIDLQGLPQILWPTHCVQNSPGADFAPGLEQAGWNGVFRKGDDPAIDSYSGFFDNGQQRSTGLGDYLQAQGVTDIHVVGLATDYCVKFTALDARRLGFGVSLIEDACRGVDLTPGDSARAVEEMRAAGVRIVNSASMLDADAEPLNPS
jgi:nicotinamidase/pyrazinamidase